MKHIQKYESSPYVKLVSLVMAFLVLGAGCATNNVDVDGMDRQKQADAITGQSDEIPEDTCPYCIMYDDQLYVTWCEETPKSLLENVEKLGVIAFSVPGNRLPTKNLQTNAEKLISKSLWRCDGLLFIETDQDDVFWRLHEYQDGENPIQSPR